MKYLRTKSLLIAVLFFLSAPSFAEKTFRVTRIVDGDTIVLNKNIKVRLVGVDTPEFHYSKKLKNDAARSHRDIITIQELGKRASSFTSELLLHKKVTLEFDQNRTDRYKRTLAYVILPDGVNANKEIVKQGYGVAYVKYPFKYMDEFRAAEKDARENKRGLWADGDVL